MKCQTVRAVYARLTDLTFGVFGKTTGRQRGLDGFDGFDGFSLKGYAYARGKFPLSRLLCLGIERSRQIRQIRQPPAPVLRFYLPPLPSTGRQMGVKRGWSRCQA